MSVVITRFATSGLHCPSCSMLIEMEVGGLEGVTGVTVDHRTGVAQVSHDTDRIRPEDIVAVITKLGYGAEVDSA